MLSPVSQFLLFVLSKEDKSFSSSALDFSNLKSRPARKKELFCFLLVFAYELHLCTSRRLKQSTTAVVRTTFYRR
jgi:hypothetical protein